MKEKRNYDALIGQKIEKLTVISVERAAHKRNKGQTIPLVKCLCECGKETIINGYYLGQTKSCGCTGGSKRSGTKSVLYKHGKSNTKLIHMWDGMRGRCYNKNNHKYHNYGGRGIFICDEWNNSLNFIDWALKNGYKEGLSIERKDVDKGYSPENCCFIEKKDQVLNKTNTFRVEYNGQIKPIVIWCRELNLDYNKTYYKSRFRFLKTGKKELVI